MQIDTDLITRKLLQLVINYSLAGNLGPNIKLEPFFAVIENMLYHLQYGF